MSNSTIVHEIDKLSRLTKIGGAAVTHDPTDNLNYAATDNVQFAFDQFTGSLSTATVKVGQAKKTTTFSYDAMDRRRSELRPDGSTHLYVWDGNQLVAHGTANSLTLDVPGDDIDSHIVSIDQFGTGSEWFYHQGPDQSTLAVTGSAGFVEGYTYSAFGELSISTAAGGTTSTFGNIFQFQGQLFDAATSTYSMRARQYQPAWGTFLSPDPISTAGGPSLYAFTGSRPLHNRDPLGLAANDEKATERWIYEWMATWNSNPAAPGDAFLFGPSPADLIAMTIATGGLVYRDQTTGELHLQQYVGGWSDTNSGYNPGEDCGPGCSAAEGRYLEHFTDQVLNENALYAGIPWAITPGSAGGTGSGSHHTIERVGKEISQRAKTYAKTIVPLAGTLFAGGMLLGGGIYALGEMAGGLLGGGGGAPLHAGGDGAPLYGPYTHQINKGNVGVIAETQQMISTLGRHGDEAVRATVGPFVAVQALEDYGKVLIEFYTSVMPSVVKHNGNVFWYMDQGEFLPIILTAISYPAW
jgi:RHS repeat-associated protein